MGEKKNDLGRDAFSTARRQAGLLNTAQLHDFGYSREQIYYRAQNGVWQRAAPGVYNVVPGHPWRDRYSIIRLQAAWTGLLAVPRGISTGVCALALHGVWGLPQGIEPEVALPGGTKSRGPGKVRVRRFNSFDTWRIGDRLVASPVAALVQALPELPRDTAVSVVDSAMHHERIAPADLEEVREGLKGRRGARRVYPWLNLVAPLAQSPFETRARLQCHDAGLPPPTLQVSVWDDGNRAIAHGDLGWERDDGTWVLVDLDGRRYHEGPKALLVDRRRQNAIALTARHTHLRFAWEDLRSGVIPSTIARALWGPGGSARLRWRIAGDG